MRFFNEVVDVQDKTGYGSCLADTASVREIERGSGCDQGSRYAGYGGMVKTITQTEKTNTRQKRNSQYG